jgi:WD40 repeat protein
VGAFSPDGRILATEGFSDRDPKITGIVFWDITTGKIIGNLPVEGWVKGLSYSPDGKIIASSESDADDRYQVRIWDVAEREELFALPARKDGAEHVAISHDGKTLATWDEKRILLWDIGTRKMGSEFEAPKTIVFASVHFIPDGRVLALSYATYQSYNEHTDIYGDEELEIVRVWDVRQQKQLFVADNRPKTIYYATLSPDGAMLATASSDTSILLWPLQAPEEEITESKPPPRHRPQRFLGGRCIRE